MHWAEEAILKIKEAKISHRNWVNVLTETVSLLMSCSPGEVVCITGPSRAGKTKLSKEIESIIEGGNVYEESGYIPFISLLAKSCVRNNYFDSKHFIITCLEKIKHPFYGVNAANDPWGIERYKLLSSTSESVLRESLETGIRLRRSLYLLIDELQHILRFYGGMAAAASFLDSLKAIAQETGIILIFVGAYPVLDAIRLSPHLVGRDQVIELPRYKQNREDVIVFYQILDAYNKFIPIDPKVKSLREWGEFLYNGSLGCLGLLEKWLRSALAIAHAKNDNYLSMHHIQLTRKSNGDLTELLGEIVVGEKNCADKELFSTVSALKNEKIIEKISKPTSKKKKSKTPPFRPNPRRYPVDSDSDSED